MRVLCFLLGLAALLVALVAIVCVALAIDDNARKAAEVFAVLAAIGLLVAHRAFKRSLTPASGRGGRMARGAGSLGDAPANLISNRAKTDEELVARAEQDGRLLEIVAAELRSLSPDMARRLSSVNEWARLPLNRLPSLSAETAEVLSQHLGPLHLDGLTELSPICARHLAQIPSPLHLNGLHAISEETAEALSKHLGWLFLDGLTSLPTPIARHLAQHSFIMHLGSLYNMLSFNGVKDLSPDAACALARFPGNICLNGLANLRPDVAQCLATHVGVPKYPGAEGCSLALDGLTTLSSAAATAIAQHNGSLSFNGIETLSREALEALARHRGESLSLGRLQAMTDEVAEQFGNHTKHLYLPNLRSISRRGLAALKRNPSAVLPRQLADDDGGATADG